MHSLKKRSMQAAALGAALISSLAFAGTALAAGPSFAKGERPAVVGVVATTPDGSGTFTVTRGMGRSESNTDGNTATPTTYTVTTTSGTTVTKSGASSSVSAVASGDHVMVIGTASGTTVAATSIVDGTPGFHRGMGGPRGKWSASTTAAISGNGEPVVGGTVSAVNGNSVTITNKSNVTYTVNVSSATVTKPGVTGATIGSIVVGDSVVVQGSVNGTAVTASSVMDNGAGSLSGGTTPNPRSHGFFGAIGGFFSHLFGFF